MKKIWIFGMIVLTMLASSCEQDEDVDPRNGDGNIIDEDISAPMTLTADKTWIISGGIEVMADLTIEPGTTVKFEQDSYLSIGWTEFGSLKAVGTADKPILFTSAAPHPSSGDYEGIQFYEYNSESASELRYCTIEYAGDQYYAALTLDNTSVKMSYCTVTKAQEIGIEVYNMGSFNLFENNTVNECGKSPVVIEASAVHTISGNNTITANPGYGIKVLNGRIEENVTWKKQTVPYIMEQYVSIEGDATSASLTIEPGSVLRFDTEGYIEVGYTGQGQLVANGTAEEPIIFTSNASSPSAGDWEGIMFYSSTISGTLLNNCEVSYAGAGYYHEGAVAIDDAGSNVTVSNSEISESASNGIYVYNSAPDLNNNTFTNISGEDIFTE